MEITPQDLIESIEMSRKFNKALDGLIEEFDKLYEDKISVPARMACYSACAFALHRAIHDKFAGSDD